MIAVIHRGEKFNITALSRIEREVVKLDVVQIM